MKKIDTIVVGGSQSGLAMSRALTGHAVEHVVLERGRIGERWRTQSWDSLRMLTPRWLSRIGGWARDEGDPDGYMVWNELVDYLEAYAASFSLPVVEETSVVSARQDGDRFEVVTSQGTWSCRNLIVATGNSQHAAIPRFARRLDSMVEQVVPTEYRRPSDLPPGGVLVVGSSATGVQLADEVRTSGREVVLAVGRHTRLPRRYRGRDIMDWLHRMGSLGQRIDTVRDADASRAQPSLQLIGSEDGADLDLGLLQDRGVRLVGRAVGAEGPRVHLADDLAESIASAEFKCAMIRRRVDAFVRTSGLATDVAGAEPFRPVPIPDAPSSIDLRSRGIRTIVWATGFRREYSWLRMPALDGAGEILQKGGVSPIPGLYTIGLNFQRRRSSSFLVGVADDARELAAHLVHERGNRPAGLWAVA